MSVVITSDEAAKYEEERKLDVPQSSWGMEIAKMLATLALNIIVIALLMYGALSTAAPATAELSTRFMSLLEIVIGAIFGVTATQITKG